MKLCNYQIVVRWVSTDRVANRVTSNFRSLFKSDQNYLQQKFCKSSPCYGLIREADFAKTILVGKEMLLPFDLTFRDLVAWPPSSLILTSFQAFNVSDGLGRATNLFLEAWTTNRAVMIC